MKTPSIDTNSEEFSDSILDRLDIHSSSPLNYPNLAPPPRTSSSVIGTSMRMLFAENPFRSSRISSPFRLLFLFHIRCFHFRCVILALAQVVRVIRPQNCPQLTGVPTITIATRAARKLHQIPKRDSGNLFTPKLTDTAKCAASILPIVVTIKVSLNFLWVLLTFCHVKCVFFL